MASSRALREPLISQDDAALPDPEAGGRPAAATGQEQHAIAQHASSPEQEPLLLPGSEDMVVIEESAPRDTFWPCTFNLAKVIMGAGMMAIPKAFQNHLIKGEGEGVFVGGMGMYLRVQN